MAIGPGKYDALCTMVRTTMNADGAVVIVFGGAQGNGFSCQATPELTLSLPDTLEQVAREIRASFTKGNL